MIEYLLIRLTRCYVHHQYQFVNGYIFLISGDSGGAGIELE